MSVQIRPIAALKQHAIHSLIQDVGVVDTIRFLNQFRTGSGDYTAEREQHFRGMSVKDIVNGIRERGQE
ncbi:MAG TPA: hypothetical protein VFK45_03255 [Gammaproteobacteria bacterium]|nr:hypothetical protein [Gammaproteobacteria bacterium]